MAKSIISKKRTAYNKNYYRAAKNGLLGFGVCTVEWCSSNAINKYGFCNRHYRQIKSRGFVFKTYNDPSFIEKTQDGFLVYLCDRFGNVKDKARIDTDDFDKVVGRRWHLNRGYAVTGSNGEYLHRIIVGDIPDGYQVDHIDMDRLNNRKSNLRLATILQNSYNQRIPINNKSGFKGVHWSKMNNGYVVQINSNRKHYKVGVFDNKIDAAHAYNEEAKRLHGKFAAINEIN